jgi:hypothetical protein
MHGVALARIAGVSRNLTRAILSKRRFSVAVLPVMCRSRNDGLVRAAKLDQPPMHGDCSGERDHRHMGV